MRRFKPTDEQRKTVEALVGYGMLYDQICLLVTNSQTGKPIDHKTLMKHFRHELDTGALKANAKVTESLYKSAIAGNAAQQIWWTKCRMGWKDTTVHDHTGTVKIERIERTIVDPKHSDR